MSPRKKQRKTKQAYPHAHLFLKAGIGLILSGLILMIGIFWPVITLETAYHITRLQEKTDPQYTQSQSKTVQPIDPIFGIVIPKIGANAKIIPNVDPYDSKIYQRALTKGVAHAKGSVFPGRIGNMFLFSHSSVNFYEAMRFNAVFYLLNKLESGDEMYVYYDNKEYVYEVFEIKRINPTQIAYLTEKTNEPLLTLMTCWPPGTTFERLIVRAKLSKSI